MANSSAPAQRHWFLEAARWFYDGWSLAQFIVATGLGAFVARMTGANWLEPTPWLLTLFATGTGAGVVRTLRALLRVVKRRWNPSVVLVTAEGGTKATIVIDHHGEPVTISAVGRLLNLASGDVNPWPQRFRAEIQGSGDRAARELELQDGDFAQIVIADVRVAEFGGSYLAFRRGGYGEYCKVPDSGGDVEITVSSKKGRFQPITRVVRFSRRGRSNLADASIVDG